MGKSVIIVESPAKSKTISSFVGSRYKILGSLGNVRDLPKTRLGVDVEDDFKPNYRIIPDRRKVVKQLQQEAKGADEVYIATDPDREGEAIAWHLVHALKLKHPLRIEFNEITRRAVQRALETPRDIDMNRVNAQQARRILDRLVGYKLSPLLWRKIQRGLSAGRVQSVALRLVCDREREIQSFVPVEYWRIEAIVSPVDEERPFPARLVRVDGEKAEIPDETTAKQLVEEVRAAELSVSEVTEKERRRRPPAPFITSTLQQAASSRLRLGARRTMRLAQQLYEGLDVGEESAAGLITYMRTDSTRIADEAREEAQSFILDKYGKPFVGDGVGRSRRRGQQRVQDAHEAIRPTSVARTPEEIAPYLDRDQLRLYDLIWRRFVASQMAPAVYDALTVDIAAGRCLLRATGQTLKFPGFLQVLEPPKSEGDESAADKDEATDSGSEDAEADPQGDSGGGKAAESEEGAELDAADIPPVTKGQPLRLLEITPSQHFTEPPPRYTEATLVRALEENGIGRPSTYAQIVSTIRERKYVKLEKRRFVPTELGFLVSDRLVEHFPDILDVQFTAGLEERLDQVESGNADWIALLHEFYDAFEADLVKAAEEMSTVEPEKTDLECPKCSKPLVVRRGRFGKFLACTGYPDCRHTQPVVESEEGEGVQPQPPPEVTDVPCPECGQPMVVRRGRSGGFLGCSKYPECRGTRPLPEDIICPCPRDECPGQIVRRRSRKGRTFYGCDQYPKCEFTLWQKPTGDRCPACQSLLIEKQQRDQPPTVVCSNKECPTNQKDEAPDGDGD